MNENQIRAVEDFKRIAGRLCALIDSASELPREDLFSRLHPLLPDLIKGAISLPPVSYEDNPAGSDFSPRPIVRMRDLEWRQLYELLREKFRPNVMYWDVSDSWKGSESLEVSLADDIADIYRDLKNGGKELDMRDMAFEWRLGFYSHWGRHAVGALKAIHDLMANARS